MAEPFLSEIRIVSFGFAPRGWAFCNGQTLPIAQNQALFALLGTTFGGNGTTNFQLPNFQARMPVHQGSGFNMGSAAGQSAHTLIATEMPAHNHLAQGVSNPPTSASAAGNTWPVATQNPYSQTPNTSMSLAALSTVGNSQPHDNMPPYLTLNFIIALSGIFPSRN